jgi:hypothetical protein
VRREEIVMRFLFPLVPFALFAAGCNLLEGSSGSGAPSAAPAGEKPTAAAPATVGGKTTTTGGSGYMNAKPAEPGAAPAAPAQAPAAESFFAGDVPASVKMKPIKTFAIEPGILFLQGVEGWSGGQLPGYDYMGMSKDQSAVVRVVTSTAVLAEMNCKDLASAAAMAPLKAKNVKESSPAVLRQVGKNKFVAREGVCTADGQRGPVEIHFIDIMRKNRDDFWHYAAMTAFPQDASPELKNEAMAWARSLDYQGGNGYKVP